MGSAINDIEEVISLFHESKNFSLLNQAEYLYLRVLSEPRDNSLRIVVQEAIGNMLKTGQLPTDDPLSQVLENILKDSHPIESTESCKSLELYWKHYAAYLITGEGVGSSASTYDDELFTGKLLRVYTKSHFLDHIAWDTGAHFKPVQHYKLICLNHLVDVASYEPPDIRLIPRPPDAGLPSGG